MADRGFADPRQRHPSQYKLDTVFAQQIHIWKDEDPPLIQQQAVPATLVEGMVHKGAGSGDFRQAMIGALAVEAFFFLLWAMEYTPTSRKTRTVPLRKDNVKFFVNGHVISNDAD